MANQKKYPAINIQFPISRSILNGEKTIETRTYPIPSQYIERELLLVETPGKAGGFKARIVAKITFSECFKYSSLDEFRRDERRHKVLPGSQWDWTPKNPKWGWKISRLEPLQTAKPARGRRGIIFTREMTL